MQLDKHLSSKNLYWLFGAGISKNANIPLMAALTNHVFKKVADDGNPLFGSMLRELKDELPEDAHIEHILSHLGDFATLAERSKYKKVKVGSISRELSELRDLHTELLKCISETIRWGYIEGDGGGSELVGTRDQPIVQVDTHADFISAVFNRSQAGVEERRGAVKFFTINYDTLLEDALALNCITYWDGFSGGAVAFRNHNYRDDEPDSGFRAHVIKLHGSIDWYQSTDDRIWRIRDGDRYPERTSRDPRRSSHVLIYPQATKYLATQRDPFASQFDLFRRSLNSNSENVLAICGYSFGDEHINQEIELALQQSKNKTTILAFSSSINNVLQKWQSLKWSKRLYIVSKSGLYVGSGLFYPPETGKELDCWTFGGATKLLNNGAEACL